MTATSGATAGGDAGSETRPNRLSHLVRLLGPTTLLTGLLYFYGYVSLKAYYSYFGISLSALDLATTDYLVRTPDTLFRPFAALVLVLVGIYVAHFVLVAILDRSGPDRARWIAIGGAVVATLLGALGLYGLYGSPRGYWSPLAFAAAALVAEYSLWIWTQFGAPPGSIRSFLDGGADLRRGLIVALVVVGAFWAVNELAQERGVENARVAEASLVLQPQAVVYSAKDLQLTGSGVNVVRLDGADSVYAYRANGLRPLLYANSRWFLLPVGWQHARGDAVIVLEDKPLEVRVDLAPGATLVAE